MKEIKFYKISSGKNPIEIFLDSLSSKEAQKITLAEQRKKEYLLRGDEHE